MNSRTRHQLPILFWSICLAWLMAGCTTIRPVGPDGQPIYAERTFSHAALDTALHSHVDDRGRVDYRALKKAPQDLEAYYRLIARHSPDSHPQLFPGRSHRLAYWINAYNSAAIKAVLTHYPVDSVLDVKTPALFFFLGDKAGFFFFQRLTFGGKTTSLYYLENKVIRKRFMDPRVHFALNCASVSCPRLPGQAFTGDALEEQLDAEARRFLAEPRNFTIDHPDRTIRLSSIFKWYEKDFVDGYTARFPDRPGSLLGYIDLYLTPDKSAELNAVADDYAIAFTPYDWRLNDRHAAK